MTSKLIGAAIAVALGLPVAAHAMSSGDYDSQKERIGSQLQASLQKCDKLSGNAEDICVARTKGAEKVAKAELDARRANYTAKARHEMRIAKAEAIHEVAVEKCDDMAGNAKDVCVKEARAALTRSKAQADADRKASETSKASRENVAEVTREADYEAAVERCDSYSGEAKSRCVADTKARFGLK